MKAAGIEYEERMERLEGVTHPRPLAEVLQPAYAIYRDSPPWVAAHPLPPKSLVCDLWEQAMTFADYVQPSHLPPPVTPLRRSLRGEAHPLVQTVRARARTDTLYDKTQR